MLSALLLASLAVPRPQAPPIGAPLIENVAVIPTAAPGAEIIAVQASTKRAVLVHSQTGQIELFDLADPAAPRSLRVFELALAKGEGLTSVAIPPAGDWFLAVIEAGPELAPGRAVAHSLADGKLLATFPCGVGPDCVAIAPSGKLALVANEAEGFDSAGDALRSAPGSVTLIRFAPALADSEVVQIVFTEPVAGATDGRTIERKIGDKNEDVELQNGPDYLEPEVVAFLPDEKRGLVTLQENNSVAYLDLVSGKVERVVPLGNTTHPADVLDDGRFEPQGTLIARREPDGIAVTRDGRYFVTADEGDTDPGVAKTPAGMPCGGGRTLSVFDLATGACLGDTGGELDRMAAGAGLYPDKRSPKKGCEPEMVTTFERDGVPYAAVTLERAGALALVDLSDPSRPAVVGIAPSGADHLKDEPEGLAHFGDPAGKYDYFYVANEGTSTLGVLRIPR